MSDSQYEAHASHETSIPRLLGGSDPPEEEPIREGLPPGFRMRADSHYVDSLDRPAADLRIEDLRLDEIDVSGLGEATPDDRLARSIEQHGLLEPLLVVRDGRRYVLFSGARRLAAARAAGLSRVPCVVREIDERARPDLLAGRAAPDGTPRAASPPEATVRALGHEMDATLQHLNQALGLTSAGGLTQQVALTLSRAHAAHALCLRRVLTAVQEAPAAPRRAADPRAIVEQALRSTEAERQLRGVAIDAHLDDAAPRALVDPDMLVSGLSLALGAALEAAELRWPGNVRLRCEAGRNGAALRVAAGRDRTSTPALPPGPVAGSTRLEAARLALAAAGCSVTIRWDDDGLDVAALLAPDAPGPTGTTDVGH